MSTMLQLRSKGSLTIPAEMRQKYALEDGDVFSLIDLGDGSFYLTPRVSVVPKLVAELESIREEAGLSLDDMLSGLSEQRKQLYRERYGERV